VRITADDKVARDEINFFPVVMHEWRRGIDARIETQKPGTASHLATLVEIAGGRML
jgi:hypothetical protein